MKKGTLFLLSLISVGFGVFLGLSERKQKTLHSFAYTPQEKRSKTDSSFIDTLREDLGQALTLYRKGYFYKCRELCQNIIANRLISQPSWKLISLVEKCKDIITITKSIIPIERNEPIHKIQLSNGKVFTGNIVFQNKNHIILMFDNNNSIGFSMIKILRANIEKLSKIPLQEIQQNLEKKSLTPSKTIPEIHFLIVQCMRNHLKKCIPRIIERAEVRDPWIRKKLIEFQRRKLYNSYYALSLYQSPLNAEKYKKRLLKHLSHTTIILEDQAQKNLPNIRRIFKPMQPKPMQPKPMQPKPMQPKPMQPKPMQPKEEQQKSPKEKEQEKLVKIGDSYYKIAYEHLKKSFPGQPNYDKELALAKKNFKQAQIYYQKAHDIIPSPEIEKQLQKVNEYYHHCIKQTRLK